MKDTENHSEPVIPDEGQDNDFPGYPKYPPSEDIYNMGREEADIDPEDVTKKKSYVSVSDIEKPNAKGFEDDVSGADLDIPGTEPEDNPDVLALEDEENNFYSIGSDDHNDLEEDNEELT